MESDRQFMQLLENLREAHESLRLEHARKVAALETEVAHLRGSPVSPAAQGGETAEKQDKAAVVLDLPDTVEEGGAPSTAESNTAPVQSPTLEDPASTGKSRTHSGTHHELSLTHEVESRNEVLWERFDGFIGGAIVLYTAVMWIGLSVEGQRNGKILVNEPPPGPSATSAFVDIMSHVFNALFLIEFLIRVYCFRTRYLYDESIQWFNIFDGSLVWITVIEAYALSGLKLNVACLRAVRIIRLLRSLRVLRTFRFFTSLRILVQTVAASFIALFWSLVLLAITMLIGALSLCQLLGSSIIDDGLDLGTRTWVNRYYGTPGRALWTMFEMTFSGCWPNYSRPLTEDVSGLYTIFFVGYIAGVVFAMTRIISALFLKDTLAIANTDADMQIMAKMKEKQAYAKKLQAFFEEADASDTSDGFITEAEFVNMLKEPRAAAYLSYLEIDPTESLNLFQIIDDGDGRISSEEFVRSALRLKGTARAQDLVMLMHELSKMKKDVEVVNKVAKATAEMVGQIHARGDQSFRI